MFNNHFRFEASFEGLWKHEKKTFRPIFISTFVSFIILILYFIVTASLDLAYINVANEIFDKSTDKNFSPEYLKNMHMFWIIFKYVASAGILVSTILMFLSVLQGYKKKNFAKIYSWPLTIYFIILFVNIWNSVSAIIQGRGINSTGDVAFSNYILVRMILTILFTIILAVAYFVFVRKYMFIKIAYINVQRYEEAKKQLDANPELKELVENIQAAFGGQLESKPSDYSAEGTEESADSEPEKMDKDDEVDPAKLAREKNYKKLMNLPNEKLYEAAQKLYISGYQSMEKATLANLILDILEQQEAKKRAENSSSKNDEKANKSGSDGEIVEAEARDIPEDSIREKKDELR
ncbi:APC family permease [Mycoplasmopsis agalactiae]|uniref:APC family permease n=1 Tax=Mycoplasmopsis agalactiae TaxID=2110 RepID=UPI001F42BBC8|nr:APC family permease [Mycoplasmopsis agalactiae]MCE6061947.1 APC family permease [Mycoplasmopsis agalactiae]